MTLGFNFSGAGWNSTDTSEPIVYAYYGSAVFSVTLISPTKWHIEFNSNIDTSSDVVYMEVEYYKVNSTMSSDIGTLTVTSSDSTTPIYSSSTNGKFGNTSYKSYRRSLILCNSQGYDIEVTDPGTNIRLGVRAFYTSVVLS